MQTWEQYSSDLYVLARDILENFYHQRHGYKEGFYYGFNHELTFLTCTPSDIDQLSLLQNLADRGMFTFEEEAIPPELPKDFIGRNVLKNPTGNTFIIRILPDRFNEQFEILGNYEPKSIPRAEKLPQVIVEVSDKFSIHDKNIISYEGRAIELEPQTRRIIRLIMERSKSNMYTDIEMITDECLSEDYKERVAAKDPLTIAKHIARQISEARSKFRIATDAPSSKNFFPSKYGTGYTFEP